MSKRRTLSISRVELATAQMAKACNEAQHCVIDEIIDQNLDPVFAIMTVARHAHGNLSGKKGITSEQLQLAVMALMMLWHKKRFVPCERYPYTYEETAAHAQTIISSADPVQVSQAEARLTQIIERGGGKATLNL